MQQRSQWNLISVDLVRLVTIVLLVTPKAVELSVWMGYYPWGHFIYMSVWRRGTMSLVVIKIAASSASAAEEMINLIIWMMVIMGLFYLGLGSSSERKMCAPERLRALEKLRYAASDWGARRMSLAL